MRTGSILWALLLLASCDHNKSRESSHMDTRQKENFHIYLLMGQSNMAGRGVIEPMDTITHPRVLVLNKDYRWELAKNPLHFDKPIAGTGLGLTFGKLMVQANDQVTIGLIPCAKGGSSINQWFPDSLHPATNSYPYQEMVDKSKKVLSEGTIKGILWHQGEADTQSAEDIASYAEKFTAMINLLKSDLNLQTVPIAMGELGLFFIQNNPLASELNGVFQRLVDQSECIELVTVDGLQHKGDSVHFDSDSYRQLGERYAKTMIELQKKCPPKSVTVEIPIQSKL